MQTVCPVCDCIGLERTTFSLTLDNGVVVEGLECYSCDVCKSDPAFPDQIRRNEEKIAKARLQV